MYLFERWTKHELNDEITTCCAYDMISGEKVALVINDKNELSFHLWMPKRAAYGELLYGGTTMDELQAAVTKNRRYIA